MQRKGFDEIVVKDELGVVQVFDGTGCFAKHNRLYYATLSANGMRRVLRDDILDIPVRPDAAIARIHAVAAGVVVPGPAYNEDRKEISEYRKEEKEWDSLCSIALAILKRSISQTVVNYLIGRNVNMDNASRENIFNILVNIHQRYGIYSVERADLNYHRMTAIAPFQSVADVTAGMKKFAELIEERLGWLDPAQQWNDGQLRSFLLSKIRAWKELSFVVGRIDADTTLTYSGCTDLLMLVINRLENEALVNSAQARELAIKASPLHAQQAEMQIVKAPAQDMFRYSSANTSQVSSSIDDQLYGYAAYTPYNVVRRCFNCNGEDHMSYDCQAWWCYVCKSDFTNNKTAYHHNSQCPSRRTSYAQKRNTEVSGINQSIVPWKQQQLSESSGRGQLVPAFRAVSPVPSFRGRGRGRMQIAPSRGRRGPWPPQGTRIVAPFQAAVADFQQEEFSYEESSEQQEHEQFWIASTAVESSENSADVDSAVYDQDSLWKNG